VEQLQGDAEDGETEWQPDKEGFVEIVWVVRDGRAWARQVTTGIQSDTHIEIVEGLEEGEDVVTGSYRAISRDLRHGAEVLQAETGDEGGETTTGE